MPANVETAVYANDPAWHREGVVLDTNGEKGLSVPVALMESGLDWTVRKVPIFGAAHYVEDENGKVATSPRSGLGDVIQDRYGVQRESDSRILGVVGSTWQPVQNHEGFELISDFMQGDAAYIEAAGALDGGRKVWILAHMAEDMQIAGEDISRYVLFTNGHDGRTSVTAAMTDIRVVCQNTLSWALATTKRVHRVRHTTKATQRLAEAKAILGLRDLRSEELAKQGEWLVKQEMSDRQFDRFLSRLMPIPENQEGRPAETMITQRQDQVRSLWRTTDNLEDIRRTRWGALNAIVEYSDYGRRFQDDQTQLKAQFGISPNTIKNRAVELLTDGAPKSITA
jgi:phage/plasmid-like protein (TIGR03299 family)